MALSEMKFDAHVIDFIGNAFVNFELALDDIMLDNMLKCLNMDHAFTKVRS